MASMDYLTIWALISLLTFLAICQVTRRQGEPIDTYDSLTLLSAAIASVVFPVGWLFMVSSEAPKLFKLLTKERTFRKEKTSDEEYTEDDDYTL